MRDSRQFPDPDASAEPRWKPMLFLRGLEWLPLVWARDARSEP